MNSFIKKLKNILNKEHYILFDKIPYCNFCKRSKNDVEYLIKASKNLCICNDCVDVCNKILFEIGYHSDIPKINHDFTLSEKNDNECNKVLQEEKQEKKVNNYVRQSNFINWKKKQKIRKKGL